MSNVSDVIDLFVSDLESIISFIDNNKSDSDILGRIRSFSVSSKNTYENLSNKLKAQEALHLSEWRERFNHCDCDECGCSETEEKTP